MCAEPLFNNLSPMIPDTDILEQRFPIVFVPSTSLTLDNFSVDCETSLASQSLYIIPSECGGCESRNEPPNLSMILNSLFLSFVWHSEIPLVTHLWLFLPVQRGSPVTFVFGSLGFQTL